MEIIKTFGKVSIEDIILIETGVGINITWEQLLPAISEMIRLRDNEIIDGFKIDEDRITVKLSRKRGRKVNT